MTNPIEGLAKLREPFPPNQISKLPKETKAQAEARKNNREGINCTVCGGWHHPRAVHLDYVGHAALTDRLLDVDPEWSWEPVAFTDQGLPAFDQSGGLWIKLTVCGVTRLGYGHAAAKPQMDPGAREKEVIGDALRNAAMRFGAALDLWHKGDLHADEEPAAPATKPPPSQPSLIDDAQWSHLVQLIQAKGVDTAKFCGWLGVPSLKAIPADRFNDAVNALRSRPDAPKPEQAARNPQRDEVLADEIPY